MKEKPMLDLDVSYLASGNWDARMPERFRWLRENDPIHWSEADGLWLVTRFADVAWVSKHQEIFTSAEGVRPGYGVKIGLIDEAEPRHGELRALINRGFTPRMVKHLEQVFRRLTTRAIDAIAASSECDFVASISVPLPLWLIAAMIGIREEDYDRFHAWSDAMIAADGNRDKPEILARAVAAYVEYATYVTGIIEDRRREPKDDLVSILTGAKDAGLLRRFEETGDFPAVAGAEAGLHNDELIKLLVILLVAGNETTRNAISGGMQLLIENPGERRKLQGDPRLLSSAIEEMIRVVSPVHSFTRTVTRDTELGGRKIRAGQQVLLLYPSANHDAHEFPEPDRFRVDRNPHHLGFGVGSHFCLGANLARMEMRVVFEELLRRLPDMEYAAGGPVLVPSALVRCCAEMRVRYTPERAATAA
jgi:cytochrome P450 family 142 subfamily A polypeptide 1